MSARLWSTRTPVEAAFEAAWRERLARCPHANFSLDLAHLRWEAERGRHAAALLIEGPGRPAAMVLREEGHGLVSGWPWRWQAVVEHPESTCAAGLDAADAAALLEAARRVAGARRLRVLLPAQALENGSGYPLGSTLMLAIGSDEELLRGMDGDKRRAVKRAQREGYTVLEAGDLGRFRAFCALQADTAARRGSRPVSRGSDPVPGAEGSSSDPVPRSASSTEWSSPPAGESWREWEHPWMWLLVAEREGVVEAGSGFGVFPGGSIDYRTNASSDRAKRDGVNVLLAWEALRRGRERGARWMNWGGLTRFKRDLGGEPVEVACVLGGGIAWALPNRFESSLGRLRPRVAAWWQARTTGARERPA